MFLVNPILVTLPCFVLVLLAAVEETAEPPGKLARIFVFLGSRSYVYYVVHTLAYVMAQEILFRLAPGLSNDWLRTTSLVGLAFLLVVGASELLVRFVEQPFRLLGRRLTSRSAESTSF